MAFQKLFIYFYLLLMINSMFCFKKNVNINSTKLFLMIHAGYAGNDHCRKALTFQPGNG